jgi:hypothetical protein
MEKLRKFSATIMLGTAIIHVIAVVVMQKIKSGGI